MTNSDINFTESIPEFYDTYLVPLIFEDYATDLGSRILAKSPNNILETAAGSGVVTRAITSKLSDNSNLVVSDLNQAMLNQAQKLQPTQNNINWQQADALDLPFDNGIFDVVACQFGFMFFPDKVKASKEAKRVLKDGGEFIFNVWDGLENNIFPKIVNQVVCQLFPSDAPQFLDRVPYGYYDHEVIRNTLQEAGFENIAIEEKTETSSALSPLHAALAFTHGTPLRNELLARDPDCLKDVAVAVAKELERVVGEGEISAKINAFIITAS